MALKSKGFIYMAALIVTLLSMVVILQLFTGHTNPGSAYAAEDAADKSAADKKVISVTGTGEITVEPDVAYISFGIQTEAKTANAAQVANAQAFAELESVLFKEYKLDKKDVKTTGFQVQPQYIYADKEQPTISGYVATNTVQVTYRNLAKLGALLDDVSKAGVNRVDNIQFSTEKTQEYELQVLEKAMANAEAKAKVLAKYAGTSLKGILNITQNNSVGVPIQYGDYRSMASEAKMDVATTSISGGQLTISTNVSVQFEF